MASCLGCPTPNSACPDLTSASSSLRPFLSGGCHRPPICPSWRPASLPCFRSPSRITFSHLIYFVPPGLVRNPFCCSAPRQEPRLPTFLLHHRGRVDFHPTCVASFLQDGCHRSSLPPVCQAEEGLAPATLLSFVRKAKADFHLSLWPELCLRPPLAVRQIGRMFGFSRL